MARGDLAVQRVNVGEGHVGDFGMRAENRKHVLPDRLLVVAARRWPHARQVLGLEALAQIEHGRRGALVLQLTLRIAALVDEVLEPFCLGARPGAAPDRRVADGVTALALRDAHAVVQHVTARAAGGDAAAEANYLVVIGELVALNGDGETPDDSV